MKVFTLMYFQSEIFIICEIAASLFSSEDNPTLFWKVDILVQKHPRRKGFFLLGMTNLWRIFLMKFTLDFLNKKNKMIVNQVKARVYSARAHPKLMRAKRACPSERWAHEMRAPRKRVRASEHKTNWLKV